MKRNQKNAKNRRNRYSSIFPVEAGNEYELDIKDITP